MFLAIPAGSGFKCMVLVENQQEAIYYYAIIREGIRQMGGQEKEVIRRT